MKVYRFNDNNFIEYLQKTFSINNTTIMLCDSVREYLQKQFTNLQSAYNKNERVYIPMFVYDLVDILNNASIDIIYQELFDNNILEYEKEYYL